MDRAKSLGIARWRLALLLVPVLAAAGPSHAADKEPLEELARRLRGRWRLDLGKADEKAPGLERAKELGLQMDMVFLVKDGKKIIESEITLGQKRHRQVLGSWKVVQAASGGATIESVDAATQETRQTRVEFLEDGRIRMTPTGAAAGGLTYRRVKETD